mgnify:CR=1 FL=1
MIFHHVEVAPRQIRLDGQQLVVADDGLVFSSTEIPGVAIVEIPVYARITQYDKAADLPDMGTPIYDEMIAEVVE